MVGSRPAGALAGALCGVVAGSFGWFAWANDPLLGLAVAGLVVGLIACVLWAAPGWQRFGAGMVAGTVVALAGWLAVAYAGASPGW